MSSDLREKMNPLWALTLPSRWWGLSHHHHLRHRRRPKSSGGRIGSPWPDGRSSVAPSPPSSSLSGSPPLPWSTSNAPATSPTSLVLEKMKARKIGRIRRCGRARMGERRLVLARALLWRRWGRVSLGNSRRRALGFGGWSSATSRSMVCDVSLIGFWFWFWFFCCWI